MAMPVLVLLLGGCSHPAPSVVGTWEAFLGSSKGEKLYFGKPEPTQIEFRNDGTYSVRMMWGSRSLAQTGGNYQVSGDDILLSPSEDLDKDTWLGREECVLSANRRSFEIAMPRSARIPKATFYKLRDYSVSRGEG